MPTLPLSEQTHILHARTIAIIDIIITSCIIDGMIRTQIQLPDTLYRDARQLADQREISLAELVRRGLEYIIAVSARTPTDKTWKLPPARKLGGSDPFRDDQWRIDLHTRHAVAAEPHEPYGTGSGKA